MANKSDNDVWKDWTQKLQFSKNQRTLWETQVATTSHFAAGMHRVWWDDRGNMKEKNMLPHEIWRTINLFPGALNVRQSRLTMNDPHWTPKQSPQMLKPGQKPVDDVEKQAANALLQAVWDGTFHSDLSLKRTFKQAIRKGDIEGGALFYHRFDEESDMPMVDLFALWDTYSDDSAEVIYNKEWICFAVPIGIEWMKTEGVKQGWSVPDDIMGDGRLAESQFKSDFISRRMGAGFNNMPTTRVVIKGFHYGSNGLEYVVVDRVYGVLFKQDLSQYTSLCDLFTAYHPVDTGDFYARPPTMDWIDPQKTVNKLYSSIECYIDTFGQGKWLLESENVTIPVAGAMGQKIYANEGSVQQLKMEPLPQTHFTHLEQAIRQFEQISGVHGESMGRQSGSADSGKALAQLQALDDSNSNDMVDNFKLCLAQVGCKVLRSAAENWTQEKTLYHYDRINAMSIPLTVMGERSYDIRKNSRGEGTIRMRAFDSLGVEIVIGKYFSKTQKLENIERVLGVWKPGENRTTDRIIAPLVADALDIGVGEDIVRALREVQDPNLMVMDGKAMLIADGTQVIVNASDDHQAYASFYAGKAQEYMKAGDGKSAQLLNAQASIHADMLRQQQGQGRVPTGPNAPASLPEAAGQASAMGGQMPVAGMDSPQQ